MAPAADIQDTEWEFLPLLGYWQENTGLKKYIEKEIKFVGFIIEVLPNAENLSAVIVIFLFR